MARPIRIASPLFQSEHLRGQPNARQAVFNELQQQFDALAGLNLDLVVFSEGVESLGQKPDEAESLDAPGQLLQLYQQFARAERCTVAGSIKLTDGQHRYNAIAYIGPDGDILGSYHKAFLTLSTELETLTPGNGAVVVDTPAGRLGGAICYDLNFTELCDQYAAHQPDIITFASMYHGGLMQQVWAYRCRAYFVSALPFHGGGILNPYGEPVALSDCYTNIPIATVNLDRAMVHLDYNRPKFPDIIRKYQGKIDLHIPANVGSALITSRSDDISAMDIVREFDLELLDDYFARARKLNAEHRVTEQLTATTAE